MVLDQQVPLEWAFASPLELQRRLGKALDPKRIAQMDPEALAAAFSSRPALHRYPGSMATRVQELAKLVVERYHGTARRHLERGDVGRRPVAAGQGAPGIRRAEGEDLRRSAGQAARRAARRLGRGERARSATPAASAPWPTSPTPTP